MPPADAVRQKIIRPPTSYQRLIHSIVVETHIITGLLVSIYCRVMLYLCNYYLFFPFYVKLGRSTAGSSPPPQSPTFLCPLLSLSIPFSAAPQCHLSNDVFVNQLTKPHFLVLYPVSNIHSQNTLYSAFKAFFQRNEPSLDKRQYPKTLPF